MTVSTKPAIRWSDLKTVDGITRAILAAILTSYFFYGMFVGSKIDFAYATGLIFGVLIYKLRKVVVDRISRNAP